MSDWSFGLLGPMRVTHQGAARTIPVGRQQALLATLLMRPNDVVPAPTLIEQVWGSGADRSVLNVCVMRLRRSLGDDERLVIRAEGDGYRMAVDEQDVDLHRFRRLCRDAERARLHNDGARERTLLHEALDLWRGDAFAGISSTAVQTDAVPIVADERLNAVERRVAADLDAGVDAELVPELRELVGRHPFREHFWSQLMLALHRSGRQNEALDAFRDVRRSSVDELGVEPGTELRELQQRILADDPGLLRPTADVPAPDSDRTADRSYVPLVPAQLPPFNVGFRGRRRELQQLERMSRGDADAPPVALITGAPGVGKTALAVQCAVQSFDRWPDGQLYVDLRGYASESPMRPIEALSHFLRTSGLPADQIPADPAAAGSVYRSLTAGKRMLILLDNASSAEQVRPLLPGGRDCFVVVTSRDRLTGLVASDGAERLGVDTLTDDDAHALLAEFVGECRLEDEPGAGTALMAACGNLPLALRIAAANVAGRPERSIADQVDDLRRVDRLDALAVTGDERSTVRSAFRSSYDRLETPARRTFALLGLFPGPEVTPEAAAALADCPLAEARRTVDRLREAHLLTPRSDDRFVLHDLIRLYAGELADNELTADERAAAVRRLYAYYAHAVEAAADRLYPYVLRLPPPPERTRITVDLADDGDAVDWLDTEWDNLVAIVDSAADRGAEPAGCRVGAALRGYLLTRMRIVDWLTVARANLAAARTIGDRRAEAAAHLSLGDLHRLKGEFRPGIRHYERVLVLTRYEGWIEGQAAAHNNLSNLCYPQGKLQSTADHLTRALELNERAGRVAAHAANLTNLGGIQLQMGLLDEAVTNLRRAATVHRTCGSHAGESHSLTTLGETYAALGEYDRARETLRRALELQQGLGDRQHLPHALAYLSAVELEAGDHHRAAELATSAAEKAREVGNGRDAEATAIRVLACLDRAAGRHERALEQYRRALDVARKADGMEYTSVVVLIDLAGTYLDLGERGRARHYTDQALNTCRRAGYRGLLERATAVRSLC